jgi:DNA-directed RNA polymerase specialized sigma24 family protein
MMAEALPPAYQRPFPSVEAAVRTAVPAEIAVKALDPSTPQIRFEPSMVEARTAAQASVLAALSKLEEPWRTAVVLYAHGRSVELVARVLGRRAVLVRGWVREGNRSLGSDLWNAGLLRYPPNGYDPSL